MKYGIFPLICSGLLLCACTSAPIRYYTMLASPETEQSETVKAEFAVDVLPVGVPEQLDRPQLVIRKGDSEVAVLDNQRWTASLGEEIRGALSDQLTWRWHTTDASGLPDYGSEKLLRVKLQLRRLDVWPDKKILLQADWSVGFADTAEIRLNCRSQFEQPLGNGYDALANGMQQLIGRQAAEIAAAVNESGQMKCPQAAD